MKIQKQPTDTQIVLSLTFDDGTIVIATEHTAPLKLKHALAYGLTKDEARKIGAELTAWAAK